MSEWVKLEVGNNWGCSFYAYPGELLKDSGTNEPRNALMLREGLETAVRFPDQWGQVVRLVSRKVGFHYSDMGHEHYGETRRWGFEIDVHGVSVWIPLEAVEVVRGFVPRVRDSEGKAEG